MLGFFRQCGVMAGVAAALMAAMLCTSLNAIAEQSPEAPPAASAEGIAFFENNVRPVLAQNCYECHGPDKAKSGLRLDQPKWIFHGGDLGPAVVPGEPDKSLLVLVVRHQHKDIVMPPKRELTKRDIESIEQWVRMGAPTPAFKDDGAAVSGHSGAYDWETWRQFWSFRPVVKPLPPAVADESWPRNPIDRFVLHDLEARGLKPAPPADRLTLIRRATFDLLGLPPTPEEIEAFLWDESPDAYEKLIERLLASPHYGEHWGRHWLDIARYVQGSITVAGQKAVRGAQPYRDYVVRSFNSDKPYDRFVVEQLAGDLLPSHDDTRQYFDQIIAPAFLSIGPWYDECPDPNRLRLDMIDEQIDVVTRGLLGVSVQCARCHDHKFDPVPTEDYYALAGIFASTRVVDELSEDWHDGRIRQVRPLITAEQAAQNQRTIAQIEATKQQLDAYLREQHEKLLPGWRADEAKYRAAAAEAPPINVVQWQAAQFAGQVNLKVTKIAGEGEGEGEGKNAGKLVNGEADAAIEIIETSKPSEQFVRYLIEVPKAGRYHLDALYAAGDDVFLLVKINGNFEKQRAAFDYTGGTDLMHARWKRLGTYELNESYNAVQLNIEAGRFPRLVRFRLYPEDEQREARIAERANEKGLHAHVLMAFIKAAATAEGAIEPSPYPLAAGMEPYLDAPQREQVAALKHKIERLRESLMDGEPVLAVTDQDHIKDMPVHVSGEVYSVSDKIVPRGTLQILNHALTSPAMPADRSGRLQLAQWITDPSNPLTARVMVNRIWHWHFGRGIVTTTSDFGSRGTPPTHPQLLDYLAAALVEKGWSIKSMHRLIMTSSTYRQSSVVDAQRRSAFAEIDPENHQYWHFSRRRLSAEELYDAMASTIGKLPRQPAGPLNLDKSADRAMYVLTSGRSPSGLGGEIRKMFPLFDYDDSGTMISQRETSTTPAQALWWLNNPVVKSYAKKFGESLLAMGEMSDEARLAKAYELALGRPPTEQDTQRMMDYFAHCRRFEVREDIIWTRVAQALYSSNEFRYVE